MGRKVMVVGQGGREHALAWRLAQSPRCDKLYVAPGNAGTAEIAENVPIDETDIDSLLAFALKKGVDLVVPGGESSLELGIADAFEAEGLQVFGPTKAAAEIETSKLFAKKLMNLVDVPTASYRTASEYDLAANMVTRHFTNDDQPVVIKPSGTAKGKGVHICQDQASAIEALQEIMVRREHGDAGNHVIIETFVKGREVSAHAFSDGETFRMMPFAQDHKRAFDGDKGPNTGGMGAIAPLPWFVSGATLDEHIVDPIIDGLRSRGKPFVGCLYPGLMVTSEKTKVLEFNARFGDPEAQVYMRLLETDLLHILEACVEGRLRKIDIKWRPGFAACIVLASSGYPDSYETGFPITGIDEAEAGSRSVVFHAGTKRENGRLVTSGGRVLSVTGTGLTLQEALDRAYEGVEHIQFYGKQYRTDIGARMLSMRGFF